MVSSLPLHLFSLCPPPVAPLQLFYGLIFGRRPEAAPWGPPLLPACPALPPSVSAAQAPLYTHPSSLGPPTSSAPALPSGLLSQRASDRLRAGPALRFAGHSWDPGLACPLWERDRLSPGPASPSPPGKPLVSSGGGQPLSTGVSGARGLEGGGGERTGIKSQVLACPELLGMCRKGRRSQASPAFLLPPGLRTCFLLKDHHLLRTPGIHPQARATPPLFLSPLWLPLNRLKLCVGG